MSNRIGSGWIYSCQAAAKGLDARQDDYNKGICFPKSLVNNPVRQNSLDASFPLKGQVIFDFLNCYNVANIF